MLIKVTQEDIDSGRPKDCNRCPIARAIQRVLCSDFIVYVGGYSIEIACEVAGRFPENIGQTIERAKMPLECTQFIKAFDAGHRMLPFSFELPINPELLA